MNPAPPPGHATSNSSETLGYAPPFSAARESLPEQPIGRRAPSCRRRRRLSSKWDGSRFSKRSSQLTHAHTGVVDARARLELFARREISDDQRPEAGIAHETRRHL